MALIDIHQHIIHGVDDGAKTFEDTQQMLLRACAQGVGHIVATSHALPGREPFDARKYLQHLEMARSFCAAQRLPLQLHIGAEIFFTGETPRMVREGFIPTLAQTDVVLLEFAENAPREQFSRAARLLGNEGLTVVFAHVERYFALHDFRYLSHLREELDVHTQMNANTVLKKRGFFEDRWTKKALTGGYIDMVASDAHNVSSRRCRLGSCYQALAQQYGLEMANRLCYENAAQLLDIR